ncbi:hypothetical protein [Hyphobacterium sp.]|uniref:hypothetical protein n=1 Tax=Hyphobacterium sp. TaxID=2004662 RepID=UPI003BAC3CE5
MNAEDKLKAFLKADEAPAADPVFMAEMTQRMARFRMRSQLAVFAALAIAIGAVVYGLMMAAGPLVGQTLGPLLTDFAGTPGLALAAFTVAAGIYLPRLLSRTRG